MIDLAVIKVMCTRTGVQKYFKGAMKAVKEPTTRALLKNINMWYTDHPTQVELDVPSFLTYLTLKNPGLKEEAAELYRQQFKRLSAVPPEVLVNLERLLEEEALASKLAGALLAYEAGEEISIIEESRGALEQVSKQKTAVDQELTPIEDILRGYEEGGGLPWNLQILSESLRNPQLGDLIIFAAGVDSGKTSFISHLVTRMAPAVDVCFPGEKRSILWLCNEGDAKQIVLRNFQAALRCTTEELVEYSKKPSETPEYRNRLSEMYASALGGRAGVLRVFNVTGKDSNDVESIIDASNPAVVVFDMIDNIRFTGSTLQGGTRTDEVYEAMYKRVREWAVVKGFVAIATSQLSGEGAMHAYPTQLMLKDSRVGKQSAADVIIMMGKGQDVDTPNLRFIGVTKNKRGKTGKNLSPRGEVIFDSHRCCFKDNRL